MIISHRYKFIFIKTVKTAGTSIEAYLSPLCGPEDILTPVYPPVAGHEARNDRGLWFPGRELLLAAQAGSRRKARQCFGQLRARRRYYNHIPARLVRARTAPSIWNSYFKFCVERNPFDKSLSHFHMLKARGEVDDFDTYLARNRLCRNLPKYADRDGNVIVDRVLPYETLDASFGDVMAQLGIPYDGSINVRAKGEYRKDRRSYRDVITPEQRARIETAFAAEIALHGYSFDGEMSPV